MKSKNGLWFVKQRYELGRAYFNIYINIDNISELFVCDMFSHL